MALKHLLAACLLVLFSPARAADSTSYTWFDGGVKRTIYLDDSIVAEFPDPAKAGEPSPVQRLQRSAAPFRSDQGSVRLWKVSGDAKGLIRSAQSEVPAAGFSPVLKDKRTGKGRMRALPGNVIVFLKPAWTDSQIKAWAAREKLELLNKLEIGRNIYVVKTAPGLEGLVIANRLHLSGEVVSAQPDWWVEHAKR